MQHVKDTALLIITAWAAIVAGRVVALVVFSAWPAGLKSNTASAFVVCALMLLAGFAAGLHLMKHLKWQSRFKVLAVLPFCVVITTIMTAAIRLPAADGLLAKLSWAAWAQLELLVFATGVLAGAILGRFRRSEPNKAMGLTR